MGLFPSAGVVSIRTCVLVVGKRSSRCFDALRAGVSTRAGAVVRRADHTRTAARCCSSCEQMRRRLPRRRASVDQPARRNRPTAAELGGKLAARVGRPVADHPRRSRRGAFTKPTISASGRALNGEPLEPVLTATAEAQRNGDHRCRPRRGDSQLLSTGCPTSSTSRPAQKAEAQLARLAGEHRPDELAKLADKLTDCLNPDGDFHRRRPGSSARHRHRQARFRRDVARSAGI